MAQKGNRKKKAYIAFCREQVKAGKINQADGSWANYQSGKAMDRDCRAGYKL